MTRQNVITLTIGVFLTACTMESNQGETLSDSALVADTSQPTDIAPAAPEWVVRPTGAGNVTVGMTLNELAAHMVSASDTATIDDNCDYVSVTGAPDSVLFMVEQGRLVRVDVIGGGTTTAEGAKVGDDANRIMQLYPQARRTPHKYTDGFYLTVLPGAPSDTLHRYVFELDGQRVTRYRAGTFPPVEYVEGCG
jgi:hypothetical protein